MNTVRSVTTAVNNGSSPTVAVVVPAGVQIGDKLTILHYNNAFTLATMPPPVVTGAPAVAAVPNGTIDHPVSTGHLKSYTCTVTTLNGDGTVDVSVTETGSAGEDKHLVVICTLGTDLSNPIDDAQVVTSSSTIPQPAPAANPATADGLLISHVFSCGGSATGSYTAPGSMAPSKYETHTGFLSAAGGYEQLSASGSTGTRTFTAANGVPWAGISIVLRAAPTGADTTPPSVPTGLYFAAVDETTIQISWTASVDNVGVSGYDVYVNDVLTSTVIVPTYVATGLTGGTLYSFKVRARDAAGNTSGFTATISAKTDAAPAVVAQPQLAMQRKLTETFIGMDPENIVLVPHARIKNPTGGYTTEAGLPRATQTFKLINLNAANRPTIVQDGVERIADYILMGKWDAVMAVGDQWTDSSGKRYEIIMLQDGYGYETKGLVAVHG